MHFPFFKKKKDHRNYDEEYEHNFHNKLIYQIHFIEKIIIFTTDFLTVDRRSVNFCCRFVVGKIKGVLKE